MLANTPLRANCTAALQSKRIIRVTISHLSNDSFAISIVSGHHSTRSSALTVPTRMKQDIQCSVCELECCLLLLDLHAACQLVVAHVMNHCIILRRFIRHEHRVAYRLAQHSPLAPERDLGRLASVSVRIVLARVVLLLHDVILL
jgi:hypothetical protein